MGTTGTLILSGANVTRGNGYTFFAPFINVSGGSYKYYPPPSGQPPTLFYASGQTGDKDLWIHGQSVSLIGNMFAPDGDVTIDGGNAATGSGFIESQTLHIAGNFANFTGTGPIIGGTTTTTTSTVATTITSPTTIPGTTVVGTTTPDTTIAGTTVPDRTSTNSTTVGSTIGLGE
jgi:hypothetical protein